MAHEFSITVEDPRLNRGRPTNIPLLIEGMTEETRQRVLGGSVTREDYERAVQSAVERMKEGKPWPSFESVEEAVAAAKTRSAGNGHGGGPKPAPAPAKPRATEEAAPSRPPSLEAPRPFAPPILDPGGRTLERLREHLFPLAGATQNLPPSLTDAAPIHEQVEPDFTTLFTTAPSIVPRPMEFTTPRERETMREIDRLNRLKPAWDIVSRPES